MNTVYYARQSLAKLGPFAPFRLELDREFCLSGWHIRNFVVLKYKLSALVAAWILAIGLGLHTLMIYKAKAGNAGQTPQSWTGNRLVSLSSAKPTLIMFAHPRCPCTKASLGELESLLTQAKDRFNANVLFYEPDAGETSASTTAFDAWTNSSLIKEARAFPGLNVAFDAKGKLAHQFGAETSGHIVLYGSDGKLLFTGGITGSRGHLGENAGFDALLGILKQSAAQSIKEPVFGCGLFNQCTTTSSAKRN